MASAVLSRRVEKVVGHPPLVEMSAEQRREFHEALLDADGFEDLCGGAPRASTRRISVVRRTSLAPRSMRDISVTANPDSCAS